MANEIRLLLADDHAVVRSGLRMLLQAQPDMVIIGEAETGREAVQRAVELAPDVVLMDIEMPGMNGIEATRQIKAAYPDVRVLILTAYDDDPYVFALLRAGADGYVLKNTDPDDLVRAVKAVAAGGKVLAPDIAAKVVAQVASGKPAAAQEQVEALTDREVTVLRLAALGWTNKAIAAELVISDRTVQGHLANIYSKIGVTTRTEAVTKALKFGWLVLDAR